MLQDKENRDVKEVEQTPLEPAAAHPESNGTLDVAEGQAPEQRRLEQANGNSHEQADQPTAMQASAAGAGQATKGSEGRGRSQCHPHVCPWSSRSCTVVRRATAGLPLVRCSGAYPNGKSGSAHGEELRHVSTSTLSPEAVPPLGSHEKLS